MYKKILYFSISFTLLSLTPLSSKIHKKGAIFGKGYAFSLEAPKNWVLDNEVGNNEGYLAVFYPEKSSWKKSVSIMFAYAIPKTHTMHNNLQNVLKWNKKKYSQRSPHLTIKKEKSILLKNKKKALIRKYLNIKDKYSYSEAVAYIEGKTVIISIVLSSKTATHYQKSYDSFKELVTSYRWLNKNKDQQK